MWFLWALSWAASIIQIVLLTLSVGKYLNYCLFVYILIFHFINDNYYLLPL